MNCHDARERFSGLIDDALSVEERAALARHLAECADCPRELARLRGTVALLSRIEPPRAPSGFADRVLAGVEPVSWPRRLAARLFLPLSVKLPAEAAALFLVAGLAIYVFQRTPELRQAAHRESSRSAELRSAQPPVPSAAPAPAPTEPSSTAEQRSAPIVTAPRSTAPEREASATAPPSSAPLRSPNTEVRRDEFKPALEATRREAIASRSNLQTLSERGDETKSQAEAQREREFKSKAETPGGAAAEKLARAEDRAKPATTPAPPAPGVSGSSPAVQPESGRPKGAITPSLEPAPVAPPRPAPTQEQTGVQATGRARQMPLGPRTAINAPSGADVMGRLTVKDRSSAEPALVALLAETRGTLVSRRDESDGAVIEVVVPRASYAHFSEGLGRIGNWQRESEPAALPADVRITLRLAP